MQAMKSKRAPTQTAQAKKTVAPKRAPRAAPGVRTNAMKAK